jgi:excisionase family DNA binding protein
MTDDTLTTDEAAAALDLTPGTVRGRCLRGQIEATKDDAGRWQIPRSEVKRIRDERWQRYGGTDRRVRAT